MVCLLADEDQMGGIMDHLWYKHGETRIRPFIDDDFPKDFGWTAVALPPMTREMGKELCGHLRLA